MDTPEKEAVGQEAPQRRPLVFNTNKKRSVTAWLVPLVVILAIMFFLPRVMELLD